MDKKYVNELHSLYDLFDIDNYVIDYANVHYEFTS